MTCKAIVRVLARALITIGANTVWINYFQLAGSIYFRILSMSLRQATSYASHMATRVQNIISDSLAMHR